MIKDIVEDLSLGVNCERRKNLRCLYSFSRMELPGLAARIFVLSRVGHKAFKRAVVVDPESSAADVADAVVHLNGASVLVDAVVDRSGL